MTARHESWRNNTASARREHIFGPIQSLAYEAEKAGELSLWKGVGLTVLAIAAGFAVITVAFALTGRAPAGLVADAHQSTIAGEAA